MSKPILIVVLVLAVAAIFWLLGGADPFSGGAGSVDDGAGGGDGDLLGGGSGGDAADLAGDALGASRAPVLFGRSRSERIGLGGLLGRVKAFQTGKPVRAATLVLHGSGYNDEKISAQVTTDADGRFEFARIPAGDGLQLHVKGPGKYQRTYPSVSVDARSERDLGTIWLGERGALEGIVLDEAGEPVAAAQVQVHGGSVSMVEILRNFTKLFEQLDKDAEPLTTVQSDAAGRFRVAKLDPGPITLIVRAPGHQQKTQSEVMTSAGAAGGTVRVVLQAADPIAGIVVDERGRGIEGARVACLDKDDMNSVLFGRQFVLTDVAGRFRIDSPPTGGEFALIATAEGFPMLLTETKKGADELRLVLEGGCELLIRLLEKDTNRPVEGAHLMGIFGADESLGGENMNFASAVTDHRGEALFLVRPGKLQMLFLNHPEKGTGMFAPQLAFMGATGILSGPEDGTIKKPRTTLEFHVQAGVSVRGTVVDSEGAPIAGARVVVMGAMGIGGNAASREDGTYEILNQSTPITAVVASAPGYTQDFKGFGGVQGEAGEDVTHDVTMQRAATISGRVVDPDGRPLQGVRIKASSGGAAAILAQFTGPGAESITNKAGQYVLTGVQPAEKGTVLARLAGWIDSKCEAFAVASGAASEAPDVVMRKGARLEVKVEDPDGTAVRGARVEISVDSPDSVAWDYMEALSTFGDQVTRAGGKVEFRDVPNGAVTLTASKEGFAAERAVLAVKLGKTVTVQSVTVRLREAHTLRGRVMDMDGKPAAKVAISCNPIRYGQKQPADEAWAPHARTTTDTEGKFEFPDMPDVPMKLELSGEGYQETKHPVPGARGAVEIRIGRMDPGSAARLEELGKELMKVYQEWAAAKTGDEKAVVAKRMQALQREKAALESGKSVAEAKDAGAAAPAIEDEK